ncbi:MAG: TVP38/TMEM64 family protein [Lachnospiraceae bacterium]|nr:TVP38/TMEM64 family protein [Lachnospiraceae bacterium]
MKGYGIMGPLVLTLIQMLQVVVPIVPGMLGCAAGAALYGCVGGFLCNYIGISAGSILAFWLGRRYGTEFVKRVTGEKCYEKYAGWIQKQKAYTWVFALMILLPLAPDDVFCYLTGLTRMSARKFVGIILGMKPWLILAYSVVFAAL